MLLYTLVPKQGFCQMHGSVSQFFLVLFFSDDFPTTSPRGEEPHSCSLCAPLKMQKLQQGKGFHDCSGWGQFCKELGSYSSVQKLISSVSLTLSSYKAWDEGH